MEPSEKVSDYIGIACIKNQLINAPINVLESDYSENEYIDEFIKGVYSIVKNDFFFLTIRKDIVEKIEDIMVLKKIQDHTKEDNKVINEITRNLNEIKNYDDISLKILKESYKKAQEEKRNINFESDEDFFKCLATDGIILRCLELGDVSDINDTYFYGATNLFLKEIPEIYNDEEMKTMTIDKLITCGFKERRSHKKVITKTLLSVQSLN